jgi:hypothetical protein
MKGIICVSSWSHVTMISGVHKVTKSYNSKLAARFVINIKNVEVWQTTVNIFYAST